ncbi:MAG: type I restriction endonuclease [Lachnospiraceae bacterium]
MGFNEDLLQLSSRISTIKDNIQTEEATKMSMIVPFFQLLGYDVFNPTEFCPEYTADVGIKKGEKVDYAIIVNNEPAILIECKSCTEVLDKHSSQLFRYFGTSPAKFGILTNGIIYKFYTDLDESNKMDLTPFLEFDMENIKDSLIPSLKKFCKTEFDKDSIFSTASELKYSNLIKDLLKSELENPSDEFAKFILSSTYEKQKTQKVLDKFKPIIKKSFNSFINELINQKISSALNAEPAKEPDENSQDATDEKEETKIFTTQEEIQSLFIVRGILSEIVNIEDVVPRDTESYFGILYKDNNRKPICRMNLDGKRKQILIPDKSKNFERIYIESLNDIYKYKDKLIDAVKLYL